eukprot:TRINITY_DN11241_c0_g1_i3.p1 TRINITY_DN11241_c0_g1~~TRINITY_DN11241_c0_g1_i3.p1  ORF type:complete len:211 (+),score=40.92 TRINITY_DN11241_c0_g1_i3:116-748(+)
MGDFRTCLVGVALGRAGVVAGVLAVFMIIAQRLPPLLSRPRRPPPRPRPAPSPRQPPTGPMPPSGPAPPPPRTPSPQKAPECDKHICECIRDMDFLKGTLKEAKTDKQKKCFCDYWSTEMKAEGECPFDGSVCSGGEGLSGGAIAGIVVGVMLCLALSAGGAYYWLVVRPKRAAMFAHEAGVEGMMTETPSPYHSTSPMMSGGQRAKLSL